MKTGIKHANILSVVTDNVNNIIKAFSGKIQIPCFAYVLNLVAERAVISNRIYYQQNINSEYYMTVLVKLHDLGLQLLLAVPKSQKNVSRQKSLLTIVS